MAVTTEPRAGLQKGTNWWGAFVIGLAGTILVTGIAPYAVQGMGASAIWAIGVNTVFGLVLCLCLAELACMWPDRAGGIPSYASASFEPLVGPRVAKHIGGLSGWSYWLGWFPVAPINMILTAAYLSSLFGLPQGGTIHLFGSYGAPISTTVLLISFIGLLAIYVPCYFGVKLGAGFATVLGILSMVPLTVLVLLPLFKSGSFHWSNIAGFHTPAGVHENFTFIIAWMFPITWNVIAMEAAACYVGECRNGPRDAKIALTAEGVYGMLIYILTPLVFVGVLGAALSSADPLTLYTDFTGALFGHGSWIKWFIGLPLILALLLSVLNAIMGTGRSLYQASEDGALPHWFGKVNVHGVPARAMAFNVVGLDARGALRLPGPHLHLLQRRLPVRLRDVAGRLLRLPANAPGRRAPAPPSRLGSLGRPRDLPVLGGRLLLRRLERPEHRRRPELRPGPVHPWPGDHGALLPALLLAQALRPAPRPPRHDRRHPGPRRGRSINGEGTLASRAAARGPAGCGCAAGFDRQAVQRGRDR